MSPTKTAEPVEVLFGIWAQKGPRNHVLGGVVLWLKYCWCFCLHVNIAKRALTSAGGIDVSTLCADTGVACYNFDVHWPILMIIFLTELLLCSNWLTEFPSHHLHTTWGNINPGNCCIWGGTLESIYLLYWMWTVCCGLLLLLFIILITLLPRLSWKHTHPFNGPLSGTAWVSRYQKGKTNLDFTEARDSEWWWHQLGHMQVCTSLQTDNHSVFYRSGALPAAQPTASKHWRHQVVLENRPLNGCSSGSVIVVALLCTSGGRWRRPFQSVSHASSVEAAGAQGGVGRECLEPAL